MVPLKRLADEAVADCPSIRHVLVVRRIGQVDGGDESFVNMTEGRDHWWHRLLDEQSPDARARADGQRGHAVHPLHVGHHREAQGHRPHHRRLPHAGRATTRYVFDLKDEDVFWCTADVGWVTGHSYIVYGPLANGATYADVRGGARLARAGPLLEDLRPPRGHRLLHRPDGDPRLHEVGPEHPARTTSRLRLLGTVGEPINPEAWIWYHEHIGGGRCPIVDTWWQTETGGIMITPLPGVVATKPGSATIPFPGIEIELVDAQGAPLEVGGGFLTLTEPWPGMLRTIYGDDERYRETYWSRFPGRYFAGDGAKLDEDGYWWVLGRVDDVMNVAGHRIGSMEVESALVDHPAVAEAAVVGKAHDLKGQAIAAFVTLKEGHAPSAGLKDELKEHVTLKIGAIARPDDILFTADLPKTRSGKIMRRLLKDIAEGRALGDTTTLADPNVVAKLKEKYEEE
jgi:acetyl-CoA synthetase